MRRLLESTVEQILEIMKHSTLQYEINLRDHFELQKTRHLQSLADNFNERTETKKGNSVKKLMKR
jgi:hypothetical protein